MKTEIKKLPEPFQRYGVLIVNDEVKVISKQLNVISPVKGKTNNKIVYRLQENDSNHRPYLTQDQILSLVK